MELDYGFMIETFYKIWDGSVTAHRPAHLFLYGRHSPEGT